jgi:hypothetical protein
MEKEANASFEDYKNFEFTDENPMIPVKNADEIARGEVDTHHGAYTTTIEVNEDTVVKLNRIIRVDARGKEIRFEDRNARKYLVGSGGSKEEVVEKMQELSKEKTEIYEKLGRYIGDYLPEIKFFAVVDSPRRQLEKMKLYARQPSEKVLDKIPRSETTLMEVWENVDPKEELSRKGFEGLRQLSKNRNFRKQLRGFAQGAYELLEKEGIILDICDMGGIQIFQQGHERRKRLKRFEGVKILAQNEVTEIIPYPRNTSYSNRKLKFFDIYPADEMPKPLYEETLTPLIDNLRSGNWKNIEKIIKENPSEEEGRLHVLRYLVLLEKIGARL